MRRLRIRLNTSLAGPHAGFALAEEDGHLARAGLAVDWLPGHGAAAVIEDMDPADCDAAFGDLCALVARLGRGGPGPAAVFIAFNRTPLTIAVPAAGPVRHPRDLAGRRVSGHARDAAILAFPALGVGGVTVLPSAAALGEQVRAMLEEGAADGVFGFVNTIIASMGNAGLERLEPKVRFLEYADYLPDLCGNALVVQPGLIAGQPDMLRALVGAVSAGWQAAIADPARGVAAVAARNPAIDLAVETRRWRGTIAREMAGREAVPFGAVDPARLDRGIAHLAHALGLARVPGGSEVFVDDFLPKPENPL